MKMTLRLIAALCALGVPLGMFSWGAWAAPDARLIDPYWARHDESSALAIDHRAWDSLLFHYVTRGSDGIARVDYSAFGATDKAVLARYLKVLGLADPARLSRAEQLAFWINLYNALTVRVVLDHYPVPSILKITPSSLFARGPWKQDLITVKGRALSLDDIEHGILRPIWEDPRVHYVLNCASLGCPDLAGKAYKSGAIGAMLDEAARRYVNHPRGARVGRGRLKVSKIYKWYARDFGGSDKGVIAHLTHYAGPELRAALAGIDRIAGYRYDWTLNDKGEETKGER